jgi:hypothetical protein
MELCTLEKRRARIEVLIRKLIAGQEEETQRVLIQTSPAAVGPNGSAPDVEACALHGVSGRVVEIHNSPVSPT